MKALLIAVLLALFPAAPAHASTWQVSHCGLHGCSSRPAAQLAATSTPPPCTRYDSVRCLYPPEPPASCYGHSMGVEEALTCFAPLTNWYPWDHDHAWNVLYCESRGKTNAVNGQYLGLMQEGAGWGSFDPAVEIYHAYSHFYLGGGWGQWQCTGAPV